MPKVKNYLPTIEFVTEMGPIFLNLTMDDWYATDEILEGLSEIYSPKNNKELLLKLREPQTEQSAKALSKLGIETFNFSIEPPNDTIHTLEAK